MAWVAIDSYGDEYIFKNNPERTRYKSWSDKDTNCEVLGSNDRPYYFSSEIELPKGSIERLIGRKLTWEDEPVELKDYEQSTDHKVWIARDEGIYDEDNEIVSQGKLHAFYDTPILERNSETSIMEWKCSREMFEIPSYMYPNVKECQCVVYDKCKNV